MQILKNITLALALTAAMSSTANAASTEYFGNIPDIVKIDGENVFTRSPGGYQKLLYALSKKQKPVIIQHTNFDDGSDNDFGTTNWSIQSIKELEAINERIGMRTKAQWDRVTAQKRAEQQKLEEQRITKLHTTCAQIQDVKAKESCFTAIDTESHYKSALEPVRGYIKAFVLTVNEQDVAIRETLIASAFEVAQRNRVNQEIFDQEFMTVCNGLSANPEAECSVN